ncbi:MAG: hypothetical protein JRI23_36600, partial [Deltaproteobacteria bacterium]|jgi:hypothetical protein|nr:hypothetical protein [Deltaproteobacteria bacterium]MBW2537884.1 hypothetical protein [Deltaproteobacteria bacterium]
LADRALHQLKTAKSAKQQAAAAERAVHFGVEAAVGIKSRGVLLDELPSELEQGGMDAELAAEAAAVLGLCQSLRFEPDPDGDAANDLDQRTRQLVKQLGKLADKRGQRASEP